MSLYEKVINCPSDSTVKTVWYSLEKQKLLVELYSGGFHLFHDISFNVVKEFQRNSIAWKNATMCALLACVTNCPDS